MTVATKRPGRRLSRLPANVLSNGLPTRVIFALLLLGSLAPRLHAAEATSSDRTVFALGLVSLPKYEGSAQREEKILPLPSMRRGRWSLGFIEGVHYNLSGNRDIQHGPQLAYSFGRDENDAAILQGMGDIDSGLTLGYILRFPVDAFKLGIGYHQATAKNARGSRVELRGGYDYPLSAQHILGVGLSAGWVDSRYAENYFSVSESQAMNSALPVYTAKAGFKKLGVELKWTYLIDRQWFGLVRFTGSRLVGSIADSPIVESKSQQMAMFLLGYNFE